MKNKELAMEQLLELLEARPELVSALVFEPIRIMRLLKSKAARKLVLGVDVTAFLKDIISSTDGGPVALCRRRTIVLSRCQMSQNDQDARCRRSRAVPQKHALGSDPRE